MSKKGICHLACIPVRKESGSIYEMTTQLLFGETYTIIDRNENWIHIVCDYDGYQGWISLNQFQENIYNDQFKGINRKLVTQTEYHQEKLSITIGASIDDNQSILKPDWKNIKDFAYTYLNAPYLWGGRSPFGIDCSGFAQVVYKSIGIKLPRDAYQQATEGEIIDFVEVSNPGDLAFFDNADGKIVHVGIIVENKYIIHAHGKVRIDLIDQNGIYNVENQTYSHKLRLIKRFF